MIRWILEECLIMNLIKKTTIHDVIKEIWVNDIQNDYLNKALFKEDSLKNAFYHHLRRRLNDDFLKKHNLHIFTEFKLDSGQKIDLVIVEVDFEKAKSNHLKYCIKDLVVAIEFKFTNDSNDNPYYKDTNKLMNYIEQLPYPNARYYAAFIREIEYVDSTDISWVTDEMTLKINNNYTELLANLVEDSMTWKVIEH